MLQIMLLVSLESLRRRGALAWFHGIWTCGGEVLEYWMISSLKIKSNCSWKFQRNWNVPLVLVERSWWAEFNGIYLVRFGFRMWEILILKWFLPLKIQINSKNQVLEGKISWGRGNTWVNSKGHTSISLNWRAESLNRFFPFKPKSPNHTQWSPLANLGSCDDQDDLTIFHALRSICVCAYFIFWSEGGALQCSMNVCDFYLHLGDVDWYIQSMNNTIVTI